MSRVISRTARTSIIHFAPGGRDAWCGLSRWHTHITSQRTYVTCEDCLEAMQADAVASSMTGNKTGPIRVESNHDE